MTKKKTDAAVSASLALSSVGGKVSKEKNADITAVAKAMVSYAKNQAVVQFDPYKPPVPFVSVEEREAIEAVTEVIEHLQIPSSVRQLEPGEIANHIDTRVKLDYVEDVIDRAKAAIRAAAFNHFDKVAEEKGLVDETTPRNKDGNYILADKESMAVPGMDKKFVREVSKGSVTFGSSATLADRLAEAEAEGLISHADYLKVTKQTRVLDEQAFFEAAQANESLFAAIAFITQARSDSASLNLRDNKEQPQ